jgi:hypothetical protein
MRRPQLKSTFARATVPVAIGLVFLALMFLALWGVAALISGNSEDATEYLAPAYQEMGRVGPLADTIAADGPLILPDLVGDDRNVVLDHTGPDPLRGWALYLAHPADSDPTCEIELVRGTRTFTDCTGRTLEIGDLALPPDGVLPIVDADAGRLTLSLRALAEPGSGTTP